MTVPTNDRSTSRRAAMAKARQSRRPSRLGTPAGAASAPDYLLATDAGFPSLLRQAWQRASEQPVLTSALDALLTLDQHVPADVQLRALRTADEVALQVLVGRSWREPDTAPAPAAAAPGAYVGEVGLATNGRVVLRTPAQPPLASQTALVGSPLPVRWSAAALARFEREIALARRREAEAVDDCRRWLAARDAGARHGLLDQLKDAARRTAPFVLYREDRQYTNFRDRNTLTGKTLWPGHPDCTFSALQHLPLSLWSDSDVVLVVCLALLVRSSGYGRVEEANGTQLSVAHVADLLEQNRSRYQQACARTVVPPARSTRVADLHNLAEAVATRRAELVGRSFRLYREIHGPLMHKIERVADAPAAPAQRRTATICDHLRQHLPFTGTTLDELTAELVASPGWLARPHNGFGTGLESLVYRTVLGANEAFAADFAMSRGIRSLPRLVRALREEDWAEITRWEISEYFCCVVPSPQAHRHFPAGLAQLTDTAWAISSRMQYNSWHFIAGNLPQVPEVVARDYFVPPTMPDLAYYSDQHHRGHVAGKVRFTIRSPQPVDILGRTFRGFVDLRLLRCDGEPFDEQDLLAADQTSRLVATATALAARLVADGTNLEVSAFDSQWHWDLVAANGGS